MVAQVVPESRDTSILTFPVTLTDVQVISWLSPTVQFSLPLGEVTVIELRMVKSALLVSLVAALVALLTFILAWVVAGPVTVQS